MASTPIRGAEEPIASLHALFGSDGRDFQSGHGLAEIAGHFGEHLVVVVVRDGGDDGLGAFGGIGGLEDAGPHEHAVEAELHHQSGVGGRQDFAFVDVVHAEGFEDAGFDDVPDAGLRHDRNGHRVHDAEHDGRIGHAGHAPGLADVGGNAFERHDGARARFLRDLRLFGGGDVHDDAAFHHFRQTGLELKRTFFHDLSP